MPRRGPGSGPATTAPALQSLWWLGLAAALVLAGALVTYILDPGDPDRGPVTTTTNSVVAPPATPTSAPRSDAVQPGLGPFRVFLAGWVDAQVSGDVERLLASLDEAVIDRYGPEACRAHLAEVVGTVAAVEVLDGERRRFTYATDGREAQIPDAWELSVSLREVGEPVPAFTTLHLRPTEAGIRWFTDCGEPLPPDRPPDS